MLILETIRLHLGTPLVETPITIQKHLALTMEGMALERKETVQILAGLPWMIMNPSVPKIRKSLKKWWTTIEAGVSPGIPLIAPGVGNGPPVTNPVPVNPIGLPGNGPPSVGIDPVAEGFGERILAEEAVAEALIEGATVAEATVGGTAVEGTAVGGTAVGGTEPG